MLGVFEKALSNVISNVPIELGLISTLALVPVCILLFSNVDVEKKIGGPWYTPGAAFREIILWNV